MCLQIAARIDGTLTLLDGAPYRFQSTTLETAAINFAPVATKIVFGIPCCATYAKSCDGDVRGTGDRSRGIVSPVARPISLLSRGPFLHAATRRPEAGSLNGMGGGGDRTVSRL